MEGEGYDLVEVNHNLNDSYLFIIRKDNGASFEPYLDTWYGARRYEFTKYQIKETDMRVKTATFTSPHYFDLTTGQFHCLIVSPYHENFSGILLKCEYDKDSGLYNYQCQDLSRWFMAVGQGYSAYTTKTTTNADGKTEKTKAWSETASSTKYIRIRTHVSWNNVLATATSKEINKYRKRLSGLRPLEYYDYQYSDGVLKGNPLSAKLAIAYQNVPKIEFIRSLAFQGVASQDVYVNKHGVVQVIPNMFHDTDSEIRVNLEQLSDLKITFDTTNINTNIIVLNNNPLYDNLQLSSEDIVGLNLSSIFGHTRSGVTDPVKDTVGNITSTSTSSNTSSSSSNTGNPFNSKAKKAWINADNGSGDYMNSFISELKKKGWSVHNQGEYSNHHYTGYDLVTKDYAVYITVYNGFCAGTIREAYSSTMQNKLKKKGVQLVVVFDTRTWTNPNGMKPHRYGDFTGYNAGRAWDDNFSSGDPSIKDVAGFLKKNNAVYCAYPNAAGAAEQFFAGGYYKWKNR